MDPQLPNKNEIREQAAEGEPITQTQASTLASAETDLTGFGPIKGGTAATAQSMHDKQQNFIAKTGDVARKPAQEITREDAAAIQSAEVRFISTTLTRMWQLSNHIMHEQARVLGGRPPKGSASANAQALATENEKQKQT
ncbi:Putative Late embryogenesis abundant protein, SMP subgroup [Colletotrichum destructivum]|uniref:Late embryogenesis abundant protein, SMP subgroup n=1 Tax=Colletotrichum destructivum TaxID=34406 RepID=A0AAX4HVL1_9PEZI|nr:Putative Late embryogenesis abundant protein, SMP subgroup [Colletotrichum destructivum]